MKRVVMMGVLALALVAVSEQKASAWHKFGFSVGMNISAEKADNNLLWGAYRNGPHPFAPNNGHGPGSEYTHDFKHGNGNGYGNGYGNAPAGYPAPEFAGQDFGVPYAAAPAPAAPVSAPRQAPVQQLDYAPVSYWGAPVYYYPGN